MALAYSYLTQDLYETALGQLKQLASNGQAGAHVSLYRVYRDGIFAEPDIGLALKHLSHAYSLGSAEASLYAADELYKEKCFRSGSVNQHFANVEHAEQRFFKYLGMDFLLPGFDDWIVFSNGAECLGGWADYTVYLQLVEEAASRGLFEARVRLIYDRANQYDVPDFITIAALDEAPTFLRKYLNENDPHDLYVYAHSKVSSHALSADARVQLLSDAAEGGSVPAQVELAYYYHPLCNVTCEFLPHTDKALADVFLDKALHREAPIAYAKMGYDMIKSGSPNKFVEAEFYLRQAALGGVSDTNLEMAQLHSGTLDWHPLLALNWSGDLDQAIAWYSRSAKQGNCSAASQLAEITQDRHEWSWENFELISKEAHDLISVAVCGDAFDAYTKFQINVVEPREESGSLVYHLQANQEPEGSE